MSNSTTIVGTPLAAEGPPEPSFCRISGYLVDIQGTPLRGASLTVRNLYCPIAIGSTVLVLRERQTYKSDLKGYIQFDILQGATIDLELPNRMTDQVLHCHVPLRVSADLIDILFPYVKRIEFTEESPIALLVGDLLSVELRGVLSDGRYIPLTSAAVVLGTFNPYAVQKNGPFVFEAVGVGMSAINVLSFDALAVGLQLEPDGTPSVIFNQATAIFPDPLTVSVS